MPDVLLSYPSLLEPSLDVASLQKSILRLNEVVQMITGQRGAAEYSLQEGMLSIRKSLIVQGREISASITDINETLVSADEALAQRTTIIEAEITSARSGEASLLARITEVNLARVNGDVALAQRATNLEVEVVTARVGQPSLAARVNAVDLARVTGDSALATSINTVSTTVGEHSASLTVQQTSIDGIELKYGVTGFIGGISGGFVLTGAQQVGGGAIFGLEITANVIINGDLLITGTVTNPKIGPQAVSNQSGWTGAVGPGGIAYTPLSVRSGASVLVNFTGSSHGTLAVMSFSGAVVTRGYNIYVDGIPYSTHYSYDVCAGMVYGGGSSYTFYGTVAPISGGIIVTGLAEGVHGFFVINPTGAFMQMSITATELSK